VLRVARLRSRWRGILHRLCILHWCRLRVRSLSDRSLVLRGLPIDRSWRLVLGLRIHMHYGCWHARLCILGLRCDGMLHRCLSIRLSIRGWRSRRLEVATRLTRRQGSELGRLRAVRPQRLLFFQGARRELLLQVWLVLKKILELWIERLGVAHAYNLEVRVVVLARLGSLDLKVHIEDRRPHWLPLIRLQFVQ
jgi:hypothetical protein